MRSRSGTKFGKRYGAVAVCCGTEWDRLAVRSSARDTERLRYGAMADGGGTEFGVRHGAVAAAEWVRLTVRSTEMYGAHGCARRMKLAEVRHQLCTRWTPTVSNGPSMGPCTIAQIGYKISF